MDVNIKTNGQRGGTNVGQQNNGAPAPRPPASLPSRYIGPREQAAMAAASAAVIGLRVRHGNELRALIDKHNSMVEAARALDEKSAKKK